MNMLVRVRPQQVEILRSIHEIHLTEQGQIYAIIIGENTTTFVDNAGIMTYYEVKHLTSDEEVAYDEKQRLEKEREAAEKIQKNQVAQQAAIEQEQRQEQEALEKQQRQQNRGGRGTGHDRSDR